ncbi:MAG: ABC transporter permease [Pseudorhodobacter sp.]|nr:ABC transporter permease [Frankiaceae bacterium]
MTAPLNVDTAATTAAPETALAAGPTKSIEGRSLSQIAWMRLKRDRVALGGAIFIITLVLVAICAPLLVKIPGTTPNDPHTDLLNRDLGGLPYGRLGGVSLAHPLGVEPSSGRDIFARLVYGARVSLLIALIATLFSITVGGIAGIVAGFFGGKVDAVISRVMDVLLAFPVLVFSIALIGIVPPDFPRLLLLVFVIGFFGWPYIGRIIRGQTLSLREREFVDAARSLGASNSHIIFRQLLPNLVAPLLVYSTLIIPTNILTEAAFSYLGVGVKVPTASWGVMLTDAGNWYTSDPAYMLFPGLTLFITVLAFNLLGDGLRDALDPRAGR